MNKDLVLRQQALALKELGFDEDCIAVTHRDGTVCSIVVDTINCTQIEGFAVIKNSECVWEDDEECINGIQEVATPTYSQAFRWLRDKHDLHHEIIKGNGINISTNIFFVPTTQIGLKRKVTYTPQCSYEKAQLTCIIKLIEIVKNKNK